MVIGKTGQWFVAAKAVATQVVESMQVVGVTMRKQDGIEAANFVTKSLSAQIRRSVDKKYTISKLDHYGTAEPLVSGIFRQTNRAVPVPNRVTFTAGSENLRSAKSAHRDHLR